MPTSTAIDRGTLTIDETAARLGIDRGTAYRLAKANRLPVPVIQLGKRMVIGREALERVLAGDPKARDAASGGAL
jgi:excisionase family DNA binding protein